DLANTRPALVRVAARERLVERRLDEVLQNAARSLHRRAKRIGAALAHEVIGILGAREDGYLGDQAAAAASLARFARGLLSRCISVEKQRDDRRVATKQLALHRGERGAERSHDIADPARVQRYDVEVSLD